MYLIKRLARAYCSLAVFVAALLLTVVIPFVVVSSLHNPVGGDFEFQDYAIPAIAAFLASLLAAKIFYDEAMDAIHYAFDK